jgi:dihydroorotate dehydrogenase (NAD+) catalytic subunit
MLNSIGLANIGVQEFITGRLPHLRTLGTAIVANIAAGTIEEYSAVLSLLEEQTGIDGYEINVSCPNVKEGGLSFGTNCDLTARITRTLRPLTKKALIIKLTPNVTRIADFAKAVADEGADAVSAINTLVGMSIDVQTRKPKIATVTGGLSGPAIRPVALAKVYEIRQAVKIPIIGIGGITTGNDAIEFLLAGATAVQVGTANFINPASAVDVAEGIRSYCENNNIPDVRHLIGGMITGTVEPVLKSWL